MAQGEHHAGEDGLYGIFVLTGSGKFQSDLGSFLIHSELCTLAQHIRNGVGSERHGCGNGCADDVGARFGITAVAGAAESGDSALHIEKFNSCHDLQSDLFNLDLGVRLSVAAQGLGVLLGTILENDDLLGLDVLQNRRLDLGTLDNGLAECGVLAVHNCQNLIEDYGLFSFSVQLFDVEFIAFLHAVLLTAGKVK